MGTHPINLALRFLLELSALTSVGVFGWVSFQGSSTRWLAAIGLPLVFMMLWGVFAVPDDPSRSGSAPVPVAGAIRLGLEIALFSAATAALAFADRPRLALALGAIVLAHYVVSWDRIQWLLQH